MVFSVGKQNIQETKGCSNVVFLSMCKRVLGCTPLYKQYRYVLPQRVWFWCRFGLKMGIDFAHFGLE